MIRDLGKNPALSTWLPAQPPRIRDMILSLDASHTGLHRDDAPRVAVVMVTSLEGGEGT